ncbi:MAG: SDR family NAD(P)-dependent oxidoreductase, partial [Actinomycetota bacterium]
MGVAVVTGAAGGLGRAIAVRLATDGLAVAALDVDRTELAATTDEVSATGGLVRAFTVDLRDVAATAEVLAGIETDLGPIEVLVNNAAVFPAGPIEEVTPAVYDDVIAVNQRAYFFTARAVAGLMRAAGRPGAIVNLLDRPGGKHGGVVDQHLDGAQVGLDPGQHLGGGRHVPKVDGE